MKVYNITPKTAVQGDSAMAVHQAVIPWLSRNAITVLEKRYLRRDQNGRVIEQGNHAELMQRQGHYWELFTTQAKRYLAAEPETQPAE